MDRLFKAAMATIAVLTLVVLAFIGGFVLARASDRTVQTDSELEQAVEEVADIIDREALEPSTDESQTAGAISGMLESLDDPYAMYFDEKHYGYFNEQNSGIFYGIGVTIQNRENDLVIASVIEGTPAEAAGLKADDIIVEIDGETRPKWDTEEAVLRIRGEEGTKVTLGIRRNGAEELTDYTITRAKIDVPNIESEMLEDGVGYIRLYSFNEQAAEDVADAIETLSKDGAKGFIFDLRDNPGGLLSESVDVSSLFVEDGVIVRVEDREGTVEEHRATGRVVTDAPLVVLINGNSASASEIVGGALQDYDRATLVGEKSFGKGSVQQIEELSFGGAVKLTIAHYVTPKGQEINGNGLAPDVQSTMEAELQMDQATDTQLKKAIEVLKGKL
jgi:carboxyl-terminal processing protease